MTYWIVFASVVLVIIVAYALMFFYTRKRQRTFDEQYSSMKERYEVFVLNKKIVKERPKQGWMKYARFKTYQVTGKLAVSQSMRGMQMSKMQTMTFHTTKQEYEKIKTNHKYKMDIAGNYIGYILAPLPTKEKKGVKSIKGQKGNKTQDNKAKTKKVKS